MNQRIQELSKQAGDHVNEVYTAPVRSKTPGKIWEDGHVDWHTQFNEKFAELIVKECAQILFDESERLIELSSKEANPKLAEAYESCHYQCIDDITLIEKHFGVEE